MSQREAIFVEGWDAAVRYAQLSANPYARADYRQYWLLGFRASEGSAINTRPGFSQYDPASAASVVDRVKRVRRNIT